MQHDISNIFQPSSSRRFHAYIAKIRLRSRFVCGFQESLEKFGARWDNMTAEVSPAQYSALSFTMPLDVVEDYAEELEDFIHLAHVGCVEAAEDVYGGVLKQHALGSFPILAEYLELLLDNGRDAKVLATLEDITENNFTKAERQFLELTELLSRCRLDPSIMSNREAACWSKTNSTLTDVLRRHLNRDMMELESEQGDIGLEVRYSFL